MRLHSRRKITYYPIYMIAFFNRIQTEEEVYKFDLTRLKSINQ